MTHTRREVRPTSASGKMSSLLDFMPTTTTQPGSTFHHDAPAGRWAALGILATAGFLEMSTWFSASVVLPQLRAAWNITTAAGAWLTISVMIGFVAGAVLSAVFNIADIIAPRRLMLLGGLGAAAFNLGLLASNGMASAVPLRIATGAALALVYPPSMKVMATWFRRDRGAALGAMVGGLTMGSALPSLLNGLGGVHWTRVIIATSVLTTLGGLLAEFFGHDGPFPFPRAVFDPRQAALVFANRGVRLATLGYFGHMWELYAMWTWCGAFFRRRSSRARPNFQRRRSRARSCFRGLRRNRSRLARLLVRRRPRRPLGTHPHRRCIDDRQRRMRAGNWRPRKLFPRANSDPRRHLGIRCRRRFRAIFHHGHRMRRPKLRRHRPDTATRNRIHSLRNNRVARPRPKRFARMALGLRRLGSRPRPRSSRHVPPTPFPRRRQNRPRPRLAPAFLKSFSAPSASLRLTHTRAT